MYKFELFDVDIKCRNTQKKLSILIRLPRTTKTAVDMRFSLISSLECVNGDKLVQFNVKFKSLRSAHSVSVNLTHSWLLLPRLIVYRADRKSEKKCQIVTFS